MQSNYSLQFLATTTAASTADTTETLLMIESISVENIYEMCLGNYHIRAKFHAYQKLYCSEQKAW